MRDLVLIAHNVRSCHNVGSMLRTADGLGVKQVILTGYTPYPSLKGDGRMPHERAKLTKQIHKTALGAENTIKWSHFTEIKDAINELKKKHYTIVALEQTKNAVPLPAYKTPMQVAVLVGSEVDGLAKNIIEACDVEIMIPMLGAKESYNVSLAAGMALYQLRFN